MKHRVNHEHFGDSAHAGDDPEQREQARLKVDPTTDAAHPDGQSGGTKSGVPHRKAQATGPVRRFRGFLRLRQDCRCDNGGALVAKHPPQQFDCLSALTVASHRSEAPFQQGAHGEGRGHFAAGMHVAGSHLYGAGEAAPLHPACMRWRIQGGQAILTALIDLRGSIKIIVSGNEIDRESMA